MWNNKLKKGALHVWPCLQLWNNNHSTKHIGLSEQPVLVFTWWWWTTAKVVAELKGLKKCLVQSLGHCLICSSKYLTLNFHQGLPDLLWRLLLTPWVNSICWRTCKGDEEAMASLVSFTCWPGLHAAHEMHQIKDKGCEKCWNPQRRQYFQYQYNAHHNASFTLYHAYLFFINRKKEATTANKVI